MTHDAPEPIHADGGMLEGVHQEFRTLSTELANTKDPVATQAAHVEAGAGEFGGALSDGVAAFTLSWGAVLDAGSDSAGHIAANVGHFSLDLQAIDRANS